MNNVLIIAEAGVNHNGNLDLAYKLIDAAKDAGADIVKFQTAKPENCISKFAEKANYQKQMTGTGESQLEMCRRISLPYEAYIELKNYCDKIGIEFLTTAFDVDAVRFINSLVNYYKIPSGDINNLPYLIEIAKTKKPVIMSTGMASMDDVRESVMMLKKYGTQDISLLHCNTQYPTPFEDVNLRAMLSLRDEFKVRIGYSDHTKGIEVPIAAVALGATIIEKHFTLDQNMEGPDHKASLEPRELKLMISAIRNIEKALGDGCKLPSRSEKENILIAKKSIVAKRAISKGEVLSEENITIKRPANGLSPMKWFDVLGTTAICNFEEDEPIKL